MLSGFRFTEDELTRHDLKKLTEGMLSNRQSESLPQASDDGEWEKKARNLDALLRRIFHWAVARNPETLHEKIMELREKASHLLLPSDPTRSNTESPPEAASSDVDIEDLKYTAPPRPQIMFKRCLDNMGGVPPEFDKVFQDNFMDILDTTGLMTSDSNLQTGVETTLDAKELKILLECWKGKNAKLEEDVRFYRNEWESACERDRYGQERIAELESRLAHRHIVGKVYDLTRETVNQLAGELDETRAELARLKGEK